MRHSNSAVLALVLASLGSSRPVAAQFVTYSGALSLSGAPVANGFVIAGTFAPTFDPFSYKYVYGDAFGNLLSSEYSRAVADGAFRPIGGGDTSSFDGTFSGVGLNTQGAGLAVYLFAFDHPDPDLAANFALASAAGWITGGGSGLTLAAADASIFVFGQKAGSTIQLNVLPLPEPTSLSLAVLAAAVWRRRVAHRPSPPACNR